MAVAYHTKALTEGFLLREWRLEKVLGVGGFGIVYQGRSVYFDETVAIKEYFPTAISTRMDTTEVAPNDSSTEEIYALGLSKFLEEAKVLWNLSKPERHPNVVCVKSLFELNGTAYMVMDFERGVSLSEQLKSGRRFTEAELRAIIEPIADGLGRAHASGVLHRDIKPANILVDADGRAVLIDFGSARFDSGQATSTKVTFYTPPYAALEQYVKSYEQGPWTDIYALGVTLYECVTGTKPADVLERLHGASERPLASQARPGFSRSFLRAIDAAMATRPAERPQCLSEWLELFDAPEPEVGDEATQIAVRPAALPAALAPEPLGVREADRPAAPARRAPPPPPPEAVEVRRSRSPWIYIAPAAAAVLVGGGLFFASHSGRPAPAPPPKASAPPPSHPASAAAPTAPPAPAPQANAPQKPPAAAPLPPPPQIPPFPQSDFDSLVAEAHERALPPREYASLGKWEREIKDLFDRARAAAPLPGRAEEAKGLLRDANRDAAAMAREEAGALRRDAAEVLAPFSDFSALRGPATPAVLSLRAQEVQFEAARSRLAAASEVTSAVAEARAAVAGYGGLAGAAASALPELVRSERQKAQAAVMGARALGAEIESAAKGPRPWIFAPRADKDAWRRAQENAASAKPLETEVDALAQEVGQASSLETLKSLLVRAQSLSSRLSALRPPAGGATPKT